VHAYPKDFAELVCRQWNSEFTGASFFDLPVYRSAAALPPPHVLEQVLSLCYQASLLREEGRAVRFRLMLCVPRDLKAAPGRPEGLDGLPFVKPLPLVPNELRRLAAAAAFDRALIAARVQPGERFVIWGLLHSGEAWMRALEGARRSFQPLPPCLVVSVSGPGNLSVSKGSLVVARLVGGTLVTPTPSVLEVSSTDGDADAINARFLAAHARTGRRGGPHRARVDAALISLIRRQIALRIISAMRRLHHGGTLLILPLNVLRRQRQWAPLLKIKYAFPPGPPRRRFFELVLRLLDALATDAAQRFGPAHRVTWSDYVTSPDPAVHRADEAITEAVRFLACLSAVDGAVVMGQPLELLGFGAEISGRLTPVERVARALDPTAARTKLESALDVGTRHRSAYRLCQALPGVVAVVVSQDGSMRIMKRSGRRVVFSEHLGTGVLDA
jgi:hypothetical protein